MPCVQFTRFGQINDGSTLASLQVILDQSVDGYQLVEEGRISTGAAVTVSGTLVESPGGKQKVWSHGSLLWSALSAAIPG